MSSPAEAPSVLLAALTESIEAITGRNLKVDYIDYDARGNLSAVYCKKCGATIRLRIYEPNMSSSLKTFSSYKELHILCNASDHVTNCCTECFKDLTQQDLDDFLQIDAHQIIKDAARTNEPISDSLLNVLLDRSAVSVRKEDARQL